MKIGSACQTAGAAEIGPLVPTIPVEIESITTREEYVVRELSINTKTRCPKLCFPFTAMPSRVLLLAFEQSFYFEQST